MKARAILLIVAILGSGCYGAAQNRPASKTSQAKQPEWPDATPPDKTDPFWEINNNLGVNGVQYMKKEVSPGKWQWVVDEEAMKWKRDQQQRRDDLAFAMRSRVLTEAEFKEVKDEGYRLLVREMVPYNEAEMQKIFGEMLLQQFRLRAVAEENQKRKCVVYLGDLALTPDASGKTHFNVTTDTGVFSAPEISCKVVFE